MRRLDRELAADEIAPVEEHLAACAACRAQIAKFRAVSDGIGQYSAGLSDPAPAGQRRALIAALERPTAAPSRRIQATLAVAASVLLAVSISLTTRQPPQPPATPQPQIAADSFIALPYSNEILSSAGAVVMQVEVPRYAVALAGMPVGDGSAEEVVKAEVVVGADGLARGIRFLN
jgi:anti-sigma factor RsiW